MTSKAYKFKITCSLLIGEELTDISQYVSSIKVLREFDKNYTSIYIVDGVYPINVVTKLQSENANIVIDIEGYDMLSGSEDQENDMMFSEIYGVTKTIKPFNKNQNTYNYVDSNDPSNIGTETTNIKDVERQKKYSFCGLATEDMRINKTIVNVSLSHATVQDAILYVINRAAYNLNLTDIKLHVDAIDNQTVYDNIIVPAINPISAINYINDNYGIYEDGYKIFIDYPDIYITKATKMPDTTAKNITLDVLNTQEIATTYGTVSGYFVNGDNDDILVTSSLSFVKNNDTINEAIGENIVISSYDSQLNGVTTFTSDQGENKLDTIPKEKHYWNTSGSATVSSQFVNVKTVYSLSFSWANSDPNMFTPNNKFTVNDHHGMASGVYRNSSTSYVFSKNSNDNNMTLLGNTKLISRN